MSKYTLEISELLNDPLFKLFDFDYNFYSEDHKTVFENKFINHYYFNEIGFETVARFKQRLKSRLNDIYPYYKQLYETEVESKEYNFMLNKDLTETYTRDLTGLKDNEQNYNNDITSNTINNSTNTNNITTDFKESNLENGNADANLTNDNLTTVSNNLEVNTGSNENTGETTSNTISLTKSIDNNSENETTTLISKGNIGTTSTGQLLEAWRQTLLNIDMLIIEECQDLFMGVY